jgi:hypothetical protein
MAVEFLRFIGGEDFQFVGVLDVHHLITDVIGCFHQIYQWMAGISQRFSFAADPGDSQFVSDAAVRFFLALEESELLFLASQFRGIRVFDDGSQRGVSQHESARPSPSELMNQQTESVGIPFEVCQVFPFVSFQHVLQLQALSFGKVCSDGFLAGMAERRVAEIVCQTGCRNNGSYFGDMGVLQFRMLL